MQSNFPDFFFYNRNVNKIKNLTLTKQEQELLGLEKIYDVYSAKMKEAGSKTNVPEWYETVLKEETSALLKNLPYEYIRSVGSIKLYNLHDTLISKVGQYGDIITNYLRTHPDELFDINKISEKDIFNMFCDFPLEHIRMLLHIFNNHERVIFQSFSYDHKGLTVKSHINDNQFLRTVFLDIRSSAYTHEYNINDKFNELMRMEKQHSNDTVYLAKLQEGRKVNFEGDTYLVLTDKGKRLLSWCIQNLDFNLL